MQNKLSSIASELIQTFKRHVLPRNCDVISLSITKNPKHCQKTDELDIPQPVFTCSKLTTETLEQGVKYVQS